MATTKELASGLNTAIGSHYRQDTNQLLFRDFGRISRLDLIRPTATVVSSGTTVLRGTFSFNFDNGVQGSTSTPGVDVFWRQHTAVRRSMQPLNGAELALVGTASLGSITPAVLQSLPYSSTSLNGNSNATNQLTTGTVFAVRTSSGNYAKVRVVQYGRDMRIQWITYRVPSGLTVLGTGYDGSGDIVLTEDGQFAYVAERDGKLLRVRLASANRSAATTTQVATGITSPGQISLDEVRGQAYVVESNLPGRLLRINLANGAKTVLASGVRAIGLLMTNDQRFAYVTLQDALGHRVDRIEISTGNRDTIASGLQNPRFMTWSDPGESAILLAQRSGRVTLIDLTRATPQVRHIATGLAGRPASVAMVSASRVLVCSTSVITDVDFVADVFSAAGPLLQGVGHVPRDRITQGGTAALRGYADTTADPGYFFQVKDAPFGGSLSIMFNHTRAHAEGARYYRLLVGSAEPLQTWSDYLWSTTTNRFEIQSLAPLVGGYYRVRPPNQIWYNHWLAYRLNTLGLSDGLHRIQVRTYQLRNPATQVSIDSFLVRIDNHRPAASIDQIIHHLPSGTEIVGPCAIVSRPTDRFRFRITAHDAEGHLKSWSLTALWGNNKSKGVGSRTYVPTPNKKWTGLISSLVPSSPWSATVAGDATSTRCAHTFYLAVWDRVINGYAHIHKSTYHKSITIMLP